MSRVIPFFISAVVATVKAPLVWISSATRCDSKRIRIPAHY